MLIALILIILVVIILTIYLYLIYSYNDFQYPILNPLTLINPNDKVLIVYPHPDDELMASGGLTMFLKKKINADIKIISLTHGEKGDELLKLKPDELAKIRRREYFKVTKKIFKVNSEILNFPDGGLKNMKVEIKERLEEEISTFKPKLVITYERSGVYGHPDHVILSKVINEISNKDNSFKVLYSTIGPKISKKINLPVHMAEEEIKTSIPEVRVSIIRFSRRKYLGAKSYKSQKLSPGTIPLELMFAVTLNEYYTSRYE